MNTFFSQVSLFGQTELWFSAFGWLFDDGCFSKLQGWDRRAKNQLSRRLRRVPGLPRGCWETVKAGSGALTADAFLQDGCRPAVRLASPACLCEDLFRHIRRAVIHGRAQCLYVRGELYYCFQDVQPHTSVLTAYILVDAPTLAAWFRLCRETADALAPAAGKTR